MAIRVYIFHAMCHLPFLFWLISRAELTEQTQLQCILQNSSAVPAPKSSLTYVGGGCFLPGINTEMSASSWNKLQETKPAHNSCKRFSCGMRRRMRSG